MHATAALVCVSVAIAAVVVASAAFGHAAPAHHGVHHTGAAPDGPPSPENTAFLFYALDHVNETRLDVVLESVPAGAPVSVIPVMSSELMRMLGIAGGAHTHLAPDAGDFVYHYGPNPSSKLEYSAGQWLQDVRFLERQTERLNEIFRLPYNVTIAAEQCGEPNSFYSYAEKRITLCYEKMDQNWELWNTIAASEFYRDDAPGPDAPCPYPVELCTPATPESAFMPGDRTDFVNHTLHDSLYHELGHAVLDVYNVSYTGSIENVADQFSAFMILLGGAEGQEMMLDIAKMYGNFAKRGLENPSHGIHPLNIQRHYNYLCWLYGSDPNANSDLLSRDMLPFERAAWCVEEFRVMDGAFRGILEGRTNGLG